MHVLGERQERKLNDCGERWMQQDLKGLKTLPAPSYTLENSLFLLLATDAHD